MRLGFGTYLPAPELGGLLSRALCKGIRFVDTAPHYSRGVAQVIVGGWLEHLGAERSQVAVSSKGCYIGPSSQKGDLVTKGYASSSDLDRGHSLSPRLLRFQAMTSYALLGQLDYLFIHNPEVSFTNSDDFRAKIALLFAECEELCAESVIRAYGIASWGDLYRHVSLTELYDLAAYSTPARKPHFTAIQLPTSFVKFDALALAILEHKGPLIEAREHGLTTFGSSPFHGGELLRLLGTDFLKILGERNSPARACIKFLRATELVDIAIMGCKTEAHIEEVARAVASEDVLDKRIIGQVASMLR